MQPFFGLKVNLFLDLHLTQKFLTNKNCLKHICSERFPTPSNICFQLKLIFNIPCLCGALNVIVKRLSIQILFHLWDKCKVFNLTFCMTVNTIFQEIFLPVCFAAEVAGIATARLVT